MKNELSVVFILLMVTISLLGVSLKIPNFARALLYPELRVEPSLYSATELGETFDINVTINDLDSSLEAVAVQFRLCYDDTLLEVVGITPGTFMADPAWNLYGTYNISYVDVDPTYGPNVIVGIMLLPNATGYYDQTEFPEGSGILATITFKVIYRAIEPEPPASCPLALEDTLILDETFDESALHTKADGLYLAPYSQLAVLRIEPKEYHPTEMDETFDINVTINDLDSSLEAVAVQFRLCYDDTLLEVVGITPGTFMADPAWNLYGTYNISYVDVHPTYGPNVLVGIMLLPNATGYYDQPQFPEGSGILATITFKALSPCWPCLFYLEETQILDEDFDDVIKHAPYYPLNTFKVEPSTYSATELGETFDINVTINDVDPLWKAVAVQFRLCYNSTLLEVVGMAAGDWMEDPAWNLHGTYFICHPDVHPTYGPNINVGIMLLPNATTGEYDQTEFPGGSGTLATITFKAIYRTISPIAAVHSLLSLEETMILAEDFEDEIKHYAESAVYHAPHFPLAIMSVEPSLYNATALYETFNVTVAINDLDGLLGAVAVQFRLCYNSTLLEVVGVTPGTFMADPAWNLYGTYNISYVDVHPTYGPNVLVGIMLLPNATGYYDQPQFPDGGGTLATITFKVIHQHRGLEKPLLCCNLTLEETLILDETFDESIPHKTVAGQYCISAMPLADLNNDGVVDMKDVGRAAKAFGSYPGHERWDYICDINGDDKVDMRDVAFVARRFGWTA